MSDRAALLAAICAIPDEDTSRLAYADWLDEHGEGPRAAFIRAQIEYHRLRSADTVSATVDELLASETDRIDWSAVDAGLETLAAGRRKPGRVRLTTKSEGVPRVRGIGYASTGRGFFDSVGVQDAAAFLKHAGAIFRAAPITSVTFQQLTGEQAAEFAASGHLARLRELSLQFDVESDAIRVLGKHKDAAGICALDIYAVEDEEDAVDALAGGKHWSGLTCLDVGDLNASGEAMLSEEQIADLFARPQFRDLRALVAWGCGADDDAARAIIRNMPELRTLDLSQNPIPDGVRAFAGAKNLRHLRALKLSFCELQDDATALITTANLPNLCALFLDGNELTGPDPKRLAKPGRGPGLRLLDLSHSELTAPGLEALANCPAVRGVWHLALDNAHLGNGHLDGFVRRAAFDRLTCLHLGNNNITAAGAKVLSAWPGAASLQWLDVSGNAIGDAGAHALCASPYLAGLKHLHATGRAVAALKKRFKKALVRE